MIYRIQTETGSRYEIDKDNKTWKRIVEGENSFNNVRIPYGDIKLWLEPEIGKSLNLLGTPIVEGFTARLVTTSPVVSIEIV